MMGLLRGALRPSWRGNVLGTALATVTPATREALPSIWARPANATGSVPAVAASGGPLVSKANASTSRLTTAFTATNAPRSPFYACPCKGGGGSSGSGRSGGGDEGGHGDEGGDGDDALRAELAALAAEAWEAIRKARDNEERFAILKDGTKLKVTDLTMGPCLSVVKDTKTGQVFYGQNTGEFPTNLSEPLKSNRDRLIEGRVSPPGFRPGWTRARGYPGSHSEVQALDQGIKARPGAELQDFAVYNIRLKENSNGAAGTPMCRCDDCKIITDGVNALTD